jgi:hypothetical protein
LIIFNISASVSYTDPGIYSCPMFVVPQWLPACAPSNDYVFGCGIAGGSSVGAITLEHISGDAMGRESRSRGARLVKDNIGE